MKRFLAPIARSLTLMVAATGLLVASGAAQAPAATTQGQPAVNAASSTSVPLPPERALLNRYCAGCHNPRVKSGNFVLDGLDVSRVGDNPDAWEKVVRKLRGGVMPPPKQPRPDEAAYAKLLSTLQERLDQAADARANPGRTETVHRLNRLEYENAVRDLLAVQINAEDLLPADDSSYGFDNIAGVLKMSQALMERYLTAARVVSRSAIGSAPPASSASIYRVPAELQQHDRNDTLPFGTRGGTLIRHLFPLNAEYDIKVTVSNGRSGGGDPQQLEITLDGAQVKLFTLAARDPLTIRVPVTGGPHDLGVTFLRRPLDLVEQVREPFQNPDAPSGTGGPAGVVSTVTSVAIVGPYNPSGPGDTASRRRVFVCYPKNESQEAVCAKTILTSLSRHAFRGVVTPDSLQVLLDFYKKGRADGSFDDGIEFAVRRLLVSPEFLYRIEADPATRVTGRTVPAANTAGSPSPVYHISDLELASRLSFFLWSSIPDDELLDAAAQGTLRNGALLERQVRRMLADPRSETLAQNFGGQWLLVRNLATTRPGETYALSFDETLRQSMRRETELFLDSIIRENRSVMDLLSADYTFLNERLAQHYGIPNVQGSQFRRVVLPADSPRRGLLGHGSILTVTSPAIRTSPVIRGKWILNNILGAPPPDPPPNVPSLSDRKTQAKTQTMRERMSQHRANPACASCHSMIDPAGFALENFDAIGRWRTVDESFNAIDASGALPDGTTFNGVTELRAALSSHPERFAHTVTEKLLTYALGRGVEFYDMPAIRRILRDAAPEGYKMQAIILGIVKSYPFQFRRLDTQALEASAARR
jgi:mono/diheme cytochrome c family protein